jgi:hypothetical protein
VGRERLSPFCGRLSRKVSIVAVVADGVAADEVGVRAEQHEKKRSGYVMANVVVEEGQFNRMRHAMQEWNARRPAGEAEAIEVYRKGNKGQGILSFAGAQAPVLQPLLAGAAIYALVTSSWIDKIDLLKKHWILKPLVVFFLGYYLFRKSSPWATAVLAASAVLFVKAWKERPDAPKEAAGPDDEDAGRWEWDRHDHWRHEREREREREAERRAHVLGEGRGVRSAERLADRIFEHARAA